MRVSRLVLTLILVCAVAACSGPHGAPGAENRTGTVAAGAVAGAAVGTVIGVVAAVLARDGHVVGLGAEAGAALGAAVGAGVGFLVAGNNERAALTEEQLQQRAQAAHDEAQAYAASARMLRQEIAALQRDVEAVQADYRRGRVTESGYNGRMGSLAQQFEGIERRVGTAESSIRRYESDAASGPRDSVNVQAIEAAVEKMRTTYRDMRGALDNVQRSLMGRG